MIVKGKRRYINAALKKHYLTFYFNHKPRQKILILFKKILSFKNAKKRTNSGISMWNRTTISHK